MIAVDKKEIQKKKKHLERCKRYLKKEFIGIDSIIDRLIDHIQIWYLLPQILQRPMIVNLWGMTGVGKTDLIRKMVKYLDLYDRFAEIELSNVDQSSWQTSVFKVLEDSNLNDERPAIILFDEIQRFNTLDEEGKSVAQTKFMDFWELLSDGRLSRKDRSDYDMMLLEAVTRQKRNQRRASKGQKEEEENDFLSAWDIREYQRNLGLSMDDEMLFNMTENDMLAHVLNAKKEKTFYEPVNHSQTLIIVSGNLDEAFQMANQTSETDVNADIFHAFTKKITLVDIKEALSKKFRPEQVARFGNIHLIYRSLSRKDFTKLIQRELKRIVRHTKKHLGIQLTVDKSLQTLIYRNGVFPVQGVRPVFSSISDIIETNLSSYVFEAILSETDNIAIRYDEAAKAIIAQVGEQTIHTPFVGRIDDIREANEADVVANISAHEAGHALVYMLLFGLVPLQLKSKIASSYAGGFTFPHQIHGTRESMINKIKIFLAGGVAEVICFGNPNASIGHMNDRERATQLAMDYIRRYGFDDDFQAVYTMEDAYGMSKAPTDAKIETMITELLAETEALLRANTACLQALSQALSLSGTLDGEAMAAIAKQHNIPVEIKPEGYLHIANYEEQLASE